MNATAILLDLSDNPSVSERRAQVVSYSTSGIRNDDLDFMIELYPVGMATGTLEDIRDFGMVFVAASSTQLSDDYETLETMLEPTKYYAGTDIGHNHHGLWNRVYGVNTLGHGGNSAGFSSNFLFDPERNIGVVVLTNQSNETRFTYDHYNLYMFWAI